MTITRRGGPSGIIKADIPGLRVKHFSGTAASTSGGRVLIAHGVDDAAIVSWVATVQNDSNTRITEGFQNSAGFEFYVRVIPGGFLELRNAAGNSGSIVNDPFDILLFYIG